MPVPVGRQTATVPPRDRGFIPLAARPIRVSLTPERTKAYTCGALTGALGALATVAKRDGRRGVALAALTGSLCCGTLAVAFEERAQSNSSDR